MNCSDFNVPCLPSGRVVLLFEYLNETIDPSSAISFSKRKRLFFFESEFPDQGSNNCTCDRGDKK